MNNLFIADIGSNFRMSVANIFDPWNPSVMEKPTIKALQDAIGSIDLICFGGGEDISPSLYGHKNVASHAPSTPSFRDLFEKEVWKLAVAHNKPILGICRGAQLACILNGGSLIQDVRGHNVGGNGNHILDTIDSLKVPMSSYHHQMMVLDNTKHELLAWITVTPNAQTKKTNRLYTFDSSKITISPTLNKEPEVVFFPNTRALAIQGHPEFYHDAMHEAVVYTRNLVEKYLLRKDV